MKFLYFFHFFSLKTFASQRPGQIWLPIEGQSLNGEFIYLIIWLPKACILGHHIWKTVFWLNFGWKKKNQKNVLKARKNSFFKTINKTLKTFAFQVLCFSRLSRTMNNLITFTSVLKKTTKIELFFKFYSKSELII